jgi:membrane-bound serine protease (ClpP class)
VPLEVPRWDNGITVARWVVAVMLLHFAVATGANAQAARPTVTELQLEGVVDPFIAGYVAEEVEAAGDSGAEAVLLTIDTPGGLDSSMRLIVKAILASRVPVICYVSPQGARAASAGTFVLLSCSAAAMAPGTNVGAAHPVGISGAVASEKAENDAAAYIRSIAEERGRNAEWAESSVRESVSVPAEEARRIGVIDIIAPDTETLLTKLDGGRVDVANGDVVLDTADAKVVLSTPGLGTRVLHSLLGPDLAFILFYSGLGLIVLELLHPGISIPGIAGALALLASFASLGMLPFEIVGVSLLLASAALLVLDLQAPGAGVFTAGAIITLVLGGLLLFDPAVSSVSVSGWTIAPVAGLLALFLVTVVPAAQRARRMPRITDSARLLGQTAIVTEPLDPDGVVLLASESWTARSDLPPSPKGERVLVTGVDGLKLRVKPLVQEAPFVGDKEERRT